MARDADSPDRAVPAPVHAVEIEHNIRQRARGQSHEGMNVCIARVTAGGGGGLRVRGWQIADSRFDAYIRTKQLNGE